jgi:hypothetical protein
MTRRRKPMNVGWAGRALAGDPKPAMPVYLTDQELAGLSSRELRRRRRAGLESARQQRVRVKRGRRGNLRG